MNSYTNEFCIKIFSNALTMSQSIFANFVMGIETESGHRVWTVSGGRIKDEFLNGLLYFSEEGGCHDLADAEWIVMRGQLRGHNDAPFGRPTPRRPISRQGVGHPQGIFDVFS
jgi:hypothetical protein